MKTISGGFLVGAVAIAFLQTKFISSQITWIPTLILIIGVVVYGTSLYAQILVRKNTAGKPPTAMSIFAIVALIIAFIFNYMSLQ